MGTHGLSGVIRYAAWRLSRAVAILLVLMTGLGIISVVWAPAPSYAIDFCDTNAPTPSSPDSGFAGVFIDAESIEDRYGVPFQIFYGVSDNARTFWSITNAREVVGYSPVDDSEVEFADDIARMLARG